MRQTVTVRAVSDGYATVVYDRPTACHGDCDHCAGGCGSMAAKEQVTVRAENLIGAEVGDRVVIEAAGRQVFGAIFLIYALPLILFFLGYFLGYCLRPKGVVPLDMCLGLTGFFVGVWIAVLVSRRKTKLEREIRFQVVAFAK